MSAIKWPWFSRTSVTQKSTHLSRAADSGHDFRKFVYKLKKSADGSVAVKSASQ